MYKDEVRYIEGMNPHLVEAAAEDFKRVVRLIDSALPTIDEAKQKVEWEGAGKDALDRRLREADMILEALRHEYDRAGRALDDYVTAQKEAKALVGRGVVAEFMLGARIENILSVKYDDQPMRKWDSLRAQPEPSFWEDEPSGSNYQVEAVREEADRLYNEASDFYTRAKRTESQARALVVAALESARRGLPDFQADAGHAQEIINSVPGLRDETLQAARDPNARRPGDIIMNEYQTPSDIKSTVIAPLFLGRELTYTEAAALAELRAKYGKDGETRFKAIYDDAFATSNARMPSVKPDGSPGGDGNDDHNDAFRHTYWNARLTQEFGEDWTRRFTTAHEGPPENPTQREAMDLYNNEVGRKIAMSHPNATPQQLADLVGQAVREGQTVVVSADGKHLEFSDQIRSQDTGTPGPKAASGS